jgi:hypothetical protein
MEARFTETLNKKVVGNFISFARRVGTQNFDIGQKEHEGLKLKRFSRYDFELQSIFFIILSIFKVHFLMQFDCTMPCNMSDLYVPHQKKKLNKYRWCTYSRWKIALIPIVSSSETILRTRG